MRRLTNDGKDVMEVLYNLAMGSAVISQLPDGRVSEPIIPSPEVRRAAAVDLLHMLHGKPVAQTEVVKAEQEAEDVAQYAALSDDELERLLKEAGWKKAEKKRLAASGLTTEDDE
jgi:phosphoribosylcarboxyaminoimidazole (NCAIR) mutase